MNRSTQQSACILASAKAKQRQQQLQLPGTAYPVLQCNFPRIQQYGRPAMAQYCTFIVDFFYRVMTKQNVSSEVNNRPQTTKHENDITWLGAVPTSPQHQNEKFQAERHHHQKRTTTSDPIEKSCSRSCQKRGMAAGTLCPRDWVLIQNIHAAKQKILAYQDRHSKIHALCQ